MKRICLVSFCNMYVLPYANIYINKIIESGNECCLLFWDRDAVNGANDVYPQCQKFVYEKKMTPKSSVCDKITGYLNAIRYIERVLSEEKFDGLIFLQTHTAVFCHRKVLKNYYKKFIVDIRDYTLENFKWFYRIESKIIAASRFAVISSPAYKRFLPEGRYVIAHNFSPFKKEMVDSVKSKWRSRGEDDPINISFIGTVRFIDMDKRILKIFANDKRFKINYFGTGSEVLADFCDKNAINNVSFFGSFQPEQTSAFYEQTDLINNLYGHNDKFLDYALSNKLYHSAQFCMPILVCPKTYMEEISTKYNMSFVFDVGKDEDKDRLFEWFRNINYSALEQGCDEFVKSVLLDNQEFYETIDSFVETV